MIIGIFSKVILNSPSPKFKKLLQKNPITTLIAHSIAAAVITLTLLKRVNLFFLCIKNLLSSQHMAGKEKISLYCRMKRDARPRPQLTELSSDRQLPVPSALDAKTFTLLKFSGVPDTSTLYHYF